MKQQNPAIPANNLYCRKLHGFRCSHRNKWLLLASGLLSQKSLQLFEFYLDIFDFDTRHQTFGQFTVNFTHIGEIFRVKPNSIRSWHKELIVKGFIKQLFPKYIYEVANPKRYLMPGFGHGEAVEAARKEKYQPVEIVLQNSTNIFQTNATNEQINVTISNTYQSNPPSIAIVSSKFPYSGVEFTDDDKEWINEVLSSEDSSNE